MAVSVSATKKDNRLPLIKVVGTSGSGKSTLVAGLRKLGFNARPVSQEHSDVPDLWQQFDRPFILIYLHADLAAQQARRPGSAAAEESFRQERRRLAHARRAADLRIDTSALTAKDVLELAVIFLDHVRVTHADHPLGPIPLTGSATRSAPEAE
jgi:predicted ATPase